MSIHELLSEISKAGIGPDLYEGNSPLPLEALKAIISIAVSHGLEFSLMHVGRFPVHTSRPKLRCLVLVNLPVGDCSGKNRGKIGVPT